ncbi:hypothetical protein L1987_79161 [Smallanthus sonchifolius]|uniref:Uncharacterized protein n=1 Tax=Smallanthus sonchifolius TaxID=185202 RepID=A0ACB8ZF97_9ASTR|nr:hypothetical protein L1987_79161 [Smallanthus sonchifolius]
MVNVTEDMEADVQFTYSVKWFLTQHPYDKRMEKYINYSSVYVDNDVFGYSIANSSFTILILIICLLIFYIRVLRKVISSIVAILVLGVTGVFQLYLPEVFTNALAIVYALTSLVSGYTSTSFYHQLEGTRWIKNISLTGGLLFGPLFVTFVVNDTASILYESTAASPLSEIIKFSLLWIFLALPLLTLGAAIGKNSVSAFQASCKTAKCPKEVPRLRCPQMVLAGFFPFSVIIIQIHDILSAVMGYKIYTSYDSMLIMFFLLLIMTALVSVVITYFQLAAEDHEWWWRCVKLCVFCSLLHGLELLKCLG